MCNFSIYIRLKSNPMMTCCCLVNDSVFTVIVKDDTVMIAHVYRKGGSGCRLNVKLTN